MEVTALDGRAYARFLVAGAYFLKKYRAVLNDLNVFPVPDGDTGTNMHLTARSAAVQAGRAAPGPLCDVAAAAANGALMGARGNSGVILSQMLRGFSHHVRHRSQIDTFVLATGMGEAVRAAESALLKPLEGTILSVARAAAQSAYKLALREREFYRVANASVHAAFEALERTPEQLPVLREAGVVDAGGAGLVYFLEGILRFLPAVKPRTTAFPHRPVRASVFTPAQAVTQNIFCTEFVLTEATCSPSALQAKLREYGDSLIVAGERPMLRVHIHTDQPQAVSALAATFGSPAQLKIENMEQQHNLLLVDAPSKAFSSVVAVPGLGFERIAKELGAEVTVLSEGNPSVRELLLAVNRCLCETVVLITGDSNIVPAAREVVKLANKRVEVLACAHMPQAVAALLALGAVQNVPDPIRIRAEAEHAKGAAVFFAARDARIGDTFVSCGEPAAAMNGRLFAGASLLDVSSAAVQAMGARSGGVITLYYGGRQSERDAEVLAADLRAAFPGCDVEYYFGGQSGDEYLMSFDE